MRVFVTSSFKEHSNRQEVEYLCGLVKKAGFEDFSFFRDVENYQKVFTNPKELMERARYEIEKSDALMIDMTDKPTGRAIEMGIAFAQNKKIIMIMKKGTAIKETSLGAADAIILYEELNEIVNPLKELAVKWSRKK